MNTNNDNLEQLLVVATELAGPDASTTLAGNAVGIAAIAATLREVATDPSYEAMLKGADDLVAKLRAVIAKRALPWCVVHVGARAEIVFAPEPPQNAAAMRPPCLPASESEPSE